MPDKPKKSFGTVTKDVSNYLSGFTKQFGAESAFVLDGDSIPDVEVIVCSGKIKFHPIYRIIFCNSSRISNGASGNFFGNGKI